jgi:ribosome-binding factor A
MSYRIPKINSLIRQEISDLLKLEMKDPRLNEFVAITEVDTTPDLKHARIYISFMGTDEEKEGALEALTGASGYIRHELSKTIRIRHIPELSFHWDNSIERGAHILRLIEQVAPEPEEKE